MKNIFKQLGYTVSENQETTQAHAIKLFYITNNDGSIRWIWPSHVKQPLFLKFYMISGLRSKAFSMAIKLCFLLRIQNIVFKKVTYYVSDANPTGAFNLNMAWALFKGTIGPNNKNVLYVENDGIGSFIKMAGTTKAKQLIEKEAAILNRLFMSNIETFHFPEVFELKNNLLHISDISNDTKRTNELSHAHFNTLTELNELTSMKMKLSDNEGWNGLKKDISILFENQDSRMPKGMIRKLSKLVKQVNEQDEIEVCMSHGDFTPWNMYVKNNSLHIYDWELADPFKPLGFDLFHYIIQQGILVNRKNWIDIKQDIDNQLINNAFTKLSKFNEVNSELYLKLYVIFNTVYYLKLYAEQPVWHAQVYWLFSTWNEALSDFEANNVNQRELVIMDVFDFLLDKKYGAIKFQNMHPEQLSQFSDIDMCTEKVVNTQLYNYLKQHPLVNSLNMIKKSFMATQQIVFNNGDILSLDLIWTVKRKDLEILDSQIVLKNTYTNSFGVKMLDVFDNARYIGLFYALNNKPIPEKYNYYDEILLNSSNALDGQLYPFFIDAHYNKKNILTFIKAQKYNRWFKGMLNKINYVIDSLKMPFNNKGTIITFSGVDGAGKSTVIDVLKFKVEKQLRKRVVVLRHRPSLLPILSAWTKGKVAAEQHAASHLPRLGTNKNMISSLLRFGYYYADYLMGQFYVHVKYVWRGYVVIYDRYYFDFMNDSKRSNIVLPKFIFDLGFKFLLKPKFNFFLYADSSTILNRKKELNEEVINQLTDSYLKQFNALNQKDSNSNYVSINNIHLHETLHTVFDKIVLKNAA